MEQKSNGLGFQVSLGIIGFFWAGGLSLAAGNSVVTSLVRGAIGLFGLFLLGVLLRYAFHTFVQTSGQENDDQRGSFIDVSLPEQSPEEQKSKQPANVSGDDDFVPLANSVSSKTVDDEEARKMADALRYLNDDDE